MTRQSRILAEHEVRDPHRHGLPRERIDRRRPVSNPSFSTSPVIRAVRSCARKRRGLRAKRAGSVDALANCSTSGCSGANITKFAP
jgi:hypothetical protein